MDTNTQANSSVSSMVQNQGGSNNQNSSKRSRDYKKPRNRRKGFFNHPSGRFLPYDCFVR
jgi:hypothetical protein